MQKRNGLAHIRGGAVVQADLHAPTIFAPRFDHLAAFPDIVGRGFLDVHLFACLTRPDGGERVPVIWGDDGDGVNLLVVENHAEVPVGGGRHAGLLRDESQGGHEKRLVGVADGADLHVVAFLEHAPTCEVDGTLVAHADDGDVDALVGTGDGRIGLGAESHSSDRDARGANHARFDELSPVVVVRVHWMFAFIELKKLPRRRNRSGRGLSCTTTAARLSRDYGSVSHARLRSSR